MIPITIRRAISGLAIIIGLVLPGTARAQSRGVDIGGYAMVGGINFTAQDSFAVVLGRSGGLILGGGGRIGLPVGGLFVDLGAWRFRGNGERAFVTAENEVFPLGIPLQVTVTPIEITAGWRFHMRRLPKLLPYVGGGLTAMKYEESSDFATESENAEERFTGYHVMGGVEYKVTRWLGMAGEASWTTIPDALGEAGASKVFDETDLGGATIRFKITIGR